MFCYCIEKTECHFNWKLDQWDGLQDDLSQFEKEKVEFAKEVPRVKFAVYTLLSFLFTRGGNNGKDANREKALKYANEALEMCQHGEDAEQLVAVTNMMHIHLYVRETKELSILYSQLLKLKVKLRLKIITIKLNVL